MDGQRVDDDAARLGAGRDPQAPSLRQQHRSRHALPEPRAQPDTHAEAPQEARRIGKQQRRRRLRRAKQPGRAPSGDRVAFNCKLHLAMTRTADENPIVRCELSKWRRERRWAEPREWRTTFHQTDIPLSSSIGRTEDLHLPLRLGFCSRDSVFTDDGTLQRYIHGASADDLFAGRASEGRYYLDVGFFFMCVCFWLSRNATWDFGQHLVRWRYHSA
jgi:hypothetical protein